MKKTIGAAKFKEQCLQLLDSVDKDGIIITKNGKPVAQLIPFSEAKNSFIGKFKALIKVHDRIEVDLNEPEI
jgi:prevent-host-death family protein